MQNKKPEYCAMIEDYINSYRNRQGSAPSVREIAAGVGLAVSTVSKYLSYMRQNGPVKPNRSPAERVRCGKGKTRQAVNVVTHAASHDLTALF